MLRSVSSLLLACACVVCPLRLAAAGASQEPAPPEHHHDMLAAPAWTWSTDANAFVGYNYQQRHFADFPVWESQNWFMLGGSRPMSRGRLSVRGMVSLEPFTLHAQGSPQLFQTGESYQRTPLVNYQHPHDLVMALGAAYEIGHGPATYTFSADLVGSPALGPAAFMHRASARDNPQVPLTHHFVDATHITPGVLTAGAAIGSITIEASVFRGAEPDEDRLTLERPRLDSWSTRVRWQHGPWQAQASGGRLRRPEFFEPFDVTRLTASLAFDGRVRSRPLAATFVWGENREDSGFNGTSDGYLLEWDLRATAASTIYGRAERAAKELFGLGDQVGAAHPHVYYTVAAVTIGCIRDLPIAVPGRFGIGADATLYHMPPELLPYYGSSRSYHVFLRWRPRAAAPHVH
jgi:hypothetical protein